VATANGAPAGMRDLEDALRPVVGAAAREDPSEIANGDPAAARRGSVGRGRGLMVEFVRLIMVALFAVGGWQVATKTGSQTTARLLIGIVIGSGIGFVLGGVFGRTTVTAASRVEREFRRTPAAEILAGTIGTILGLLPAALLSIPLFHLPAVAAFPTVAFIYAVAAFVGHRVGRAKSDEMFALFGVKPLASGTRAGEVAVLDSSAILDGRVLSLVRMGFLSGALVVTRGVLEEIQAVADSSDAGRRLRGRKALDLLVSLKRDPSVDVVLVDEDAGAGGDVDARLVRLARDRGAVLVTNDANLAKVAAALDVRVRSIHALAEALRPQVVSGERVRVLLIRAGRDAGQAVGYLDDGTMVVVQDAAAHLGETAEVTITNVLQTASGRLVFASLAEVSAP